MNVHVQRCSDLPVPVYREETPSGDVTVFILDHLITEAGAVLLSKLITEATVGRVLLPRMREAS